MRFSLVTLALLLCHSVEGGVSRPEIAVNLDGSVGGGSEFSAGVSPVIKWAASSTVCGGNCDVEGGINLKVDESNKNPYSVWGKVKSSVFGWKLAGRFNVDSSNLSKVGVEIGMSGGPVDTGIQIKGGVDGDGEVSVSNVKVSQSVDAFGGSLKVSPSYNIANGRGDVTVSYGIEGTTVTVDANEDTQKLTVEKEFGDNLVAPSISTTGDVTLSLSRSIEKGTVSATIKPNDSVNLKWEDGKWSANLNAPMEGAGFTDGVHLGISCSGF